jgi:C_GCAxxG_C_C family probable redox protein
MLKERIGPLYLEKDFNCAETTLRAINEEFHLGLTDNEMKLVGGYGGGLCCEETCGALCGSIAAISKMMIKERAHATEGLKNACATYVAQFREKLGSTNCKELKKKYMTEGQRCLKTVELNAELAESYLRNIKLD